MIHHGDALEVLRTLPANSVDCCVTSPPYWGLRDYGVDGQIGLEKTPEEWCANLVAVFREVRRVLKPAGTCWVNLGDSYAGSWGAQGRQGKTGDLAGRTASRARQIVAAAKKTTQTGSTKHMKDIKAKDLVGAPWMVAFALRADGWYLRQDIIWHKPNPMPESVRDRCTKAHEYVFLLSKSERYFWDMQAMREPASRPEGAGNISPYVVDGERAGHNANLGGSLHKIGPRDFRNMRSVWTIPTQPTAEAHFATFPITLAERCILAGCPEGGTVIDPFAGAGTTGLACLKHGRQFIGVELNSEYIDIANKRMQERYPLYMASDSSSRERGYANE